MTYFGIRFGDQDKSWAPHKVCKPFVENLRQWSKGKRQKLAFGIQMIWREPRNHVDDCYFCLVQTSDLNKKNKNKIVCPHRDSAIRPMPMKYPCLFLKGSLQLRMRRIGICQIILRSKTRMLILTMKTKFLILHRKRFPQVELNDLVRDLGLSKESSEG